AGAFHFIVCGRPAPRLMGSESARILLPNDPTLRLRMPGAVRFVDSRHVEDDIRDGEAALRVKVGRCRQFAHQLGNTTANPGAAGAPTEVLTAQESARGHRGVRPFARSRGVAATFFAGNRIEKSGDALERLARGGQTGHSS